MGDHRQGDRVAVLSRAWRGSAGEAAFVTRQLAAAASRLAPVAVLVPAQPGPPVPDGAFDLRSVGVDDNGTTWPTVNDASWPSGLEPAIAVVDAGDQGARAIAQQHAPGTPVVDVASLVSRVGLHVAVNPLAAVRRHNGIGTTGYILVLSDRARPGAGTRRPTPLAAWLTARFPRRQLVVVEDGHAAVWQARALRGVVGVDTRTDLWRLMAHAHVMVDLRPGPLVARECVEALRFGTPLVVPAGTAAADLAAAGGGLWYRDLAEFLGCVEALEDRALRDALGAQGRQMADARYGDPAAFVSRVSDALALVGAQ